CRDVFQVEVVLIMLRVAQRGGFGVDGVVLLADVGGPNDAESFGVGGHDAVLDAIVNHLDEVAAAIGAAVQVALFRGATDFFTAGGAGDIANPGSEAGEKGIEMFDHLFSAADHHAIAALESPDTAAGADIDVVNFFGGELLGAANVVDVIGISAIHQDVVRFW